MTNYISAVHVEESPKLTLKASSLFRLYLTQIIFCLSVLFDEIPSKYKALKYAFHKSEANCSVPWKYTILSVIWLQALIY